MYEFFTLGMAHIHWSDNLNVLSAAFMHQLILTKSGVHIHMWTPHLKKWGVNWPPWTPWLRDPCLSCIRWNCLNYFLSRVNSLFSFANGLSPLLVGSCVSVLAVTRPTKDGLHPSEFSGIDGEFTWYHYAVVQTSGTRHRQSRRFSLQSKTYTTLQDATSLFDRLPVAFEWFWLPRVYLPSEFKMNMPRKTTCLVINLLSSLPALPVHLTRSVGTVVYKHSWIILCQTHTQRCCYFQLLSTA